MNLFTKIKATKNSFVRRNGIGLLLMGVLVLGYFGSSPEFKQAKNWAATALHISTVNETKINKLEIEVKKQADKPVPPPVVIVQDFHEAPKKPFTDPALLRSAHQLREHQKLADANREHDTPAGH